MRFRRIPLQIFGEGSGRSWRRRFRCRRFRCRYLGEVSEGSGTKPRGGFRRSRPRCDKNEKTQKHSQAVGDSFFSKTRARKVYKETEQQHNVYFLNSCFPRWHFEVVCWCLRIWRRPGSIDDDWRPEALARRAAARDLQWDDAAGIFFFLVFLFLFPYRYFETLRKQGCRFTFFRGYGQQFFVTHEVLFRAVNRNPFDANLC